MVVEGSSLYSNDYLPFANNRIGEIFFKDEFVDPALLIEANRTHTKLHGLFIYLFSYLLEDLPHSNNHVKLDENKHWGRLDHLFSNWLLKYGLSLKVLTFDYAYSKETPSPNYRFWTHRKIEIYLAAASKG